MLERAKEINNLLNNGYQENDVLGELRNNVSNIGASAYRLVSVCALVCLALTILAAIVKLKSDSRGREDAKARLGGGFIAVFLVFLLISLISFIAYIVTCSTV